MKFLSEILAKAGLVVDGVAKFNSAGSLAGGVSAETTGRLQVNNGVANNYADLKAKLFISVNGFYAERAGTAVLGLNNTAGGKEWYIASLGSSNADPGSIMFNNETDGLSPVSINNSSLKLKVDTGIRWTEISSTDSVTYTAGISVDAANRLQINTGTDGVYGDLKLNELIATSLAGSGTRMVVADTNGLLSTQAIPSVPVLSVFGRTGNVTAQSGDYTTAQVTESGNLYYTDARARAALSSGSGISYNSTTGVISNSGVLSVNSLTGSVTLTTSNISEGSNLYFTDARARAAVSQGTGITYNSSTGVITNAGVTSFNGSTGVITYTAPVTSVNGATGAVVLTTTNISEGSNLYFTNARSRSALSFAAGSGAYDSSTGVITIPTNTNQLTNGAGFISTISGISAGGELSGTYPNPTLVNSAVTGKVLTGLNVTGGSVNASDTILSAFGKVQNQINGLLGGSIFQTTWNASTNSPALTSSVGTKGYYYIVSVAGSTNLDGITDWQVGDWAIFDGSVWRKVDNTDAVVSVNGFTGAVSLTTANISESGNLYYTDARARNAISVSGSLSYNPSTGVISYTQPTNISTFTNDSGYVTTAGARSALSFAAGSGAYNSSTGVITIPTNTNQLTNGAGYITGNQTITLSGDVSGSGATSIVVSIGALKVTNAMLAGSISDDKILSASTWNAKQNALSGTGFLRFSGTTPSYITGTSSQFVKADGSLDGTSYATAASISGTTNFIPLFTSAGSIGNSTIFQNGSDGIFINGQASTSKLKLVNPLTSSLFQSGVEFIRTTVAAGAKIESLRDAGSGGVGLSIYTTADNTAETAGTYTERVRVSNNGITTLYGALNGTSLSMSGGANLATSSGNVGIGVTPSAWGGAFKVIQIAGTSLYEESSLASKLANNVYFSDANRYYRNGEASSYSQLFGEHEWATAPNGTANSSMTLTPRMKLTNSGELLINTTTPESGYKLIVNGGVKGTSNILTNGEFRVDPSSGDGILRMYTAGTERAAIRANATKFFIEVGTFGERLSINNSSGLLTYTGAATFSSSVTANDNLTVTKSTGTLLDVRATSAGGTAEIKLNPTSNNAYSLYTAGGTDALEFKRNGTTLVTFSNVGAATFASSVAATSASFSGEVLVSNAIRQRGYGQPAYMYVEGNAGGGGVTNPVYREGFSLSWNRSNGQGESSIIWTNSGGGTNPRFQIGYWNNSSVTEQFSISTTGAATFSSSVTASGNITSDLSSGAGSGKLLLNSGGTRFGALGTSNWAIGSGGTDFAMLAESGNGIRLFVNGSTQALTLASTGAATFSSSVTATQGRIRENLINSTTIGSLDVQKTGESAINILGTTYSSIYFGDAANHLEGGIVYDHGTNILEFRRSGNVTALSIAPTSAITATSTITATGFFESSSILLKDIISRDGDMVYFKWKDRKDDKIHIGYIAEEVQRSNPDQVQLSNGFLSVNYTEVLVQKVRALEKEVEYLKGKYGVQ